MSGISFSSQIKKEFGAIKDNISKKVTRAAILAWKEAVNNTPVLTGNLRAGWRLSSQRRSSYTPVPGVKGRPETPNFRFRISVDRRVYLFNNVPYASYVENGEGPGVRTPRTMLRKAILVFEKEMSKGAR